MPDPNRRLLHVLGGLAFTLYASVCAADDTDIYMNPGTGLPEGSEPIVMFSLDYRSNLGSEACTGDECDDFIPEYIPEQDSYSYFDVLRGALKKAMEPLDGVRVGLMLNHANDNNCAGPDQTGCSNGAYIAMGFGLFEDGDANGNKARFHGILDSMPTPGGNLNHSFQGKEMFFEMFRYLTGQGIYNGHNGWTDYGDNDKSDNLDVTGPDYAWDSSIESGGNYEAGLAPVGECTDIFTVNTQFFVANQEDDSDDALAAPISEGGLGVAPKDFTGVIEYMNDVDLADGTYGSAPDVEGRQNVRSYFLVDETKINRTTIGYARAGGTGTPLPLSADPEELADTIEDIFDQILSVSTTFVSASMPVNVFNRAEIIDNVYIALFQVDEEKRPSWNGNIKKLRLSEIDDTSLLVDSLDNPAVAGDGRIRQDALTFWTVPEELPPPDTSTDQVEGRDGRAVARGGAGQKIPGFISGSPGTSNGSGGRELFFDDAGMLSALNADSATATELQADLGAADETEAEELLAFARGLDVDDLDDDNDTSDPRQWILDAPLHSRPLPLNYGSRDGYSETNPAIYVAVGSNDGYMHFIRNTETTEAQSGEEVWAFMPRAVMDDVKTLRENGSGVDHPYMVDGSPAAYIDDANNNGTIEAGEDAYLYFGLRRGGKAYYALDVSDPENPQYMWSIDKSGDFAELGQTFSNPRVGRVDIGNGPQPVLIFAGGYDTNKDDRSTVGTDDSEGNAIYVVDAETGSLIWKAREGSSSPTQTVFEHPALVDSIPSTVSAADTDGDLLTDRILVGDTGGSVWRADLDGTDRTNWKLTRLATLGRHAAGGKENDRRFFHRPDLVPAEDENGLYDAVLIGSGDRADPLDGGGVADNYFYMIKDRNTGKGEATDVNRLHSDLGDVTDNCLQEGSSCGVDLTHGWRLQLEDQGEKSLSTPITISGTVFFTTYIPSGSSAETSCLPSEGSGRQYAVALGNAASVINYDTSDDEAGQEEGEATTKSDRSTDLNSPGIPSEVVSVPPNKVLRPDLQVDELDISTRWRTFWYVDEDSDL